MNGKNKPLDPNGINRILIEVDMRSDPMETRIAGECSAWDDLFIALEGVAVLAKLSIEEGIPPEEVAAKIQKQFNQAFIDYPTTYTVKK